MERKMCRTCGKATREFLNIFHTQGLKYKMETCLPIVVSESSLLPDTLCVDCTVSIDKFYFFMKNCLQSTLILERQLNVTESSLKSNRTRTQGSQTAPEFKNEPDLLQRDSLTSNDSQYYPPSHGEVESDTTGSGEEEEPLGASSQVVEGVLSVEDRKRSREDTPPRSENGNKRKCSKPKKLEYEVKIEAPSEDDEWQSDSSPKISTQQQTTKKKKSLPSLVKISDLVCKMDVVIACPNCQLSFSSRSELFVHLQLTHSDLTTFICGICLKQTNSMANLQLHTRACMKSHPITSRYYCQVCCFEDNGYRILESHVLVHNFLWKMCQNEIRNFDPEDYIEKNAHFVAGSPIKNFSCLECNRSDFDSFRKFSVHRRSVHLIFHCDLCNKFYGRNSHLWKHVNRVHKNHPSVTCQVCFKTSASKYHLAQHFARMHQVKAIKNEPECATKQETTASEDDSLCNDENTHFNLQSDEDEEEDEEEEEEPPEETISTHDLYNKILTNQAKNAGEYKCPKCSKGFHKRLLLRKHKKNCRPKSQKDLLTRCKSCSRIFKDRHSLTKHLINYHTDYDCEICQEKLPSKCEIVTHVRFQHPSSDLICIICENILRCKRDLLDHLADHENSFVCQFCGDALASKVKLKMHILSLHRKILSLSCGICLKLFETQHVLRSHVSAAHKEQLVPFVSCAVCGKNYGSKWKTFDHINKSHGTFFKACRLCLEVFEQDGQLESHLKCVHPGQSGLRPVKKEKIPPASVHLEDSDEEVERSDVTQTSESDCLEETTKKLESTKKAATESNGHHTKRTVYENSNDPSFCEICHKTWPAKKHLWQHYIRCHKSAAATVCGICLKTNAGYEELQVHLRETHPNLLHGQGYGSNFICRICGRYHNASSKLRLHMVIHDNFDWTLLDKFPPLPKSGSKVTHSNQMAAKIKIEEMLDDMIEQVEESTCSTTKEEAASESSSSSAASSSQEPRQLSFSSFLQTLKSDQNQQLQAQLRVDTVIRTAPRKVYSSVKEEEEEESSDSIALSSSSLGGAPIVTDTDNQQQPSGGSVTEREIESAVGSIL